MASEEEDDRMDGKGVRNETTFGSIGEVEGELSQARGGSPTGNLVTGVGANGGEEYSVDAVGQSATLERGGDYVARYPIVSLVGVGDCVHKIIKFNEVGNDV